jgi:predicted nucleotidyltransferase
MNQNANTEILEIKDIILKTVDCEKIYLFGSYAYGTPTDTSDYDFYVLVKDDAKNPLLISEDINVCLGRDGTQGRPVDIVSQYKSKFEEMSQFASLERKIAREGVVLYDKSAVA